IVDEFGIVLDFVDFVGVENVAVAAVVFKPISYATTKPAASTTTSTYASYTKTTAATATFSTPTKSTKSRTIPNSSTMA
ncbi:unnamed protein product, partial [Rotaria sp. Silwood2]